MKRSIFATVYAVGQDVSTNNHHLVIAATGKAQCNSRFRIFTTAPIRDEGITDADTCCDYAAKAVIQAPVTQVRAVFECSRCEKKWRRLLASRPGIVPVNESGSYRTGSLPETLTPKDIERVLGFPANVDDDDEKVKYSWGFEVDGHPAGIWDYKGSRWSVYDPDDVVGPLFGLPSPL